MLEEFTVEAEPKFRADLPTRLSFDAGVTFDWDVTLYRNGQPILTVPFHKCIGHLIYRRDEFEDLLDLTPLATSLHNEEVLRRLLAGKGLRANERKALDRLAPTAAEVLECLLQDAEPYYDGLDFEEWAVWLGLDPDSRQAESIYKNCMDIGRKLIRYVTPEERLALLEEIEQADNL